MDLSRTWKDLMSRLLLGMFGTLIGLFILHRRQRDEDREKRVQYWREKYGLVPVCLLVTYSDSNS